MCVVVKFWKWSRCRKTSVIELDSPHRHTWFACCLVCVVRLVLSICSVTCLLIKSQTSVAHLRVGIWSDGYRIWFFRRPSLYWMHSSGSSSQVKVRCCQNVGNYGWSDMLHRIYTCFCILWCHVAYYTPPHGLYHITQTYKVRIKNRSQQCTLTMSHGSEKITI